MHHTAAGQGFQGLLLDEGRVVHRDTQAGKAVVYRADVLPPAKGCNELFYSLLVQRQGLFRPGRLFRAAARCGQVQRLDEHSEHHKIHRDLGKAQQIQHRVVRAGRTSGKVHHKRPQKVRGKRRDSAQVQQHDEAAGDGCVRQPQNRCREAEQKIQRLRNGSQRCRKGQRQQLKGSLFAAAPPGTEDECRRNAKVAEGLGKAGVHPHDAIRKRQAEVIFGHHDHIGTGIGDAAHHKLTAQLRELERHIHQMMQPCRDEQPFQKAVQKQPDIAGSGNEAGDGRNGLLDRRPDKAGPRAQHRRQCRHAGKGPPHTGEHTAQNAAVGFFAGAVIHKGGEQAQQNAAEHAGVHSLDAQHHGLACAVQAGKRIRLRQQAQLGQRYIARCQVDKIAHQGDERRLMLFPLCQRRRKTGAEQHAQI